MKNKSLINDELMGETKQFMFTSERGGFIEKIVLGMVV